MTNKLLKKKSLFVPPCFQVSLLDDVLVFRFQSFAIRSSGSTQRRCVECRGTSAQVRAQSGHQSSCCFMQVVLSIWAPTFQLGEQVEWWGPCVISSHFKAPERGGGRAEVREGRWNELFSSPTTPSPLSDAVSMGHREETAVDVAVTCHHCEKTLLSVAVVY